MEAAERVTVEKVEELPRKRMAVRRSRGGGGGGTRAVAAWGRRCRGDEGEVSVAGARCGGGRRGGSGGGTEACGLIFSLNWIRLGLLWGVHMPLRNFA